MKKILTFLLSFLVFLSMCCVSSNYNEEVCINQVVFKGNLVFIRTPFNSVSTDLRGVITLKYFTTHSSMIIGLKDNRNITINFKYKKCGEVAIGLLNKRLVFLEGETLGSHKTKSY